MKEQQKLWTNLREDNVMARMKMIDSDDLLEKMLKNKSFAKEYKALEKEFELAKEVIALRIKANLTQAQLAKLAGTSQPAIARLESGLYTNLTLSFLRKIGDALGVSPQVHFRKIA